VEEEEGCCLTWLVEHGNVRLDVWRVSSWMDQILLFGMDLSLTFDGGTESRLATEGGSSRYL